MLIQTCCQLIEEQDASEWLPTNDNFANWQIPMLRLSQAKFSLWTRATTGRKDSPPAPQPGRDTCAHRGLACAPAPELCFWTQRGAGKATGWQSPTSCLGIQLSKSSDRDLHQGQQVQRPGQHRAVLPPVVRRHPTRQPQLCREHQAGGHST